MADRSPQKTGDRLQQKLQKQLSRTSVAYQLIEPNDRILVALSGGKDSYALLYLLLEVLKKLPFDVHLLAVNLDQGHPGFQQQVIVEWCDALGVPHHMLHRDTLSIVKAKVAAGKTYCSLCSRLRRGILYQAAVELGCNKIALGHHRDDTIETLLLNLLHSGQIKAMPPKLTSDDGRNIVIRPLLACEESDLAQFAIDKAFPVLPCDLCGSQENLQRQQVKRMIADWHAKNPNIKSSLFASLSHVRPSHLLDHKLRAGMGVDDHREDDASVI